LILQIEAFVEKFQNGWLMQLSCAFGGLADGAPFKQRTPLSDRKPKSKLSPTLRQCNTHAPFMHQDIGPMQSSEQFLRFQVAAATLLLNDLGILGYSGHIAARLLGRDALLIQSFEQSRSSVGPDDLLICDLAGEVIAGAPGGRPPSEVYLHAKFSAPAPTFRRSRISITI
jgi:hypothetical protein